MHLIALHDQAGSSNPLGVSGNYDRLPFAPYFLRALWENCLFVRIIVKLRGPLKASDTKLDSLPSLSLIVWVRGIRKAPGGRSNYPCMVIS